MIDAAVYNQCVRCGLCLPACPTYLETSLETSGPRGRIALIRAVDEGRLDLTDPGYIHQMHECLDCRACEAVCPSGVAYGRLIEPARAAIERTVATKRAPFQRMVRYFTFGVLFGRLGWMRLAASVCPLLPCVGAARARASARDSARLWPRRDGSTIARTVAQFLRAARTALAQPPYLRM